MKYIFAILCFCLPFVGLAQKLNDRSPFTTQNTLYVEALGSGFFYSINYERLLILKKKLAYGFRVGTSYFGNRPGNLILIGEMFTLIGKGNHHGDFGLGLTGVIRNNKGPDSYGQTWRNHLIAVPRLSYRYQKPMGGLMVRAGIIPLVNTNRADSTTHFRLWPSLSIGYSF